MLQRDPHHLANRTLFHRRLSRRCSAWAAASGGGRPAHNLDGFREVNNTLGQSTVTS